MMVLCCSFRRYGGLMISAQTTSSSTNDKQQHRALWHYINWPFKPDGQPRTVQTREPEAVNILTAMAENERIARNGTDPERKAIALAWIFHLVGDIHQPLHTAQLF